MYKVKLITRFAALLIAGSVGFSSTVVAEEDTGGGYIGVRYASLEYSAEGGTVGNVSVSDGEWDLGVVFMTPGYQVNPYFAVEARLGIGVGDDGDDIAVTTGQTTVNVDVDVEIEHYYGVFARLGAPVDSVFAPYVTAGYGRGKTDAELSVANTSISVDDSESDFAYGVGVNLNFGETVSGNVEYMNYLDKDNTEIKGFAVGLIFRF